MPERDYIAATRDRVVVFDGGMGATLEQFELTAEDYGGLAGKCHEALVLNRPDVIEGVHASMLEAGADVVETDTFQGAPSARTASSPARSGRPASSPPRPTRPSATSPSAAWSRSSPSRPAAWSKAAPI